MHRPSHLVQEQRVSGNLLSSCRVGLGSQSWCMTLRLKSVVALQPMTSASIEGKQPANSLWWAC
jgi:hypothetical protein